VTGPHDEPILAIDFGTRYSTAYVVPPRSGDPKPVREPHHDDRWPSAVLAVNGRVEVGTPAHQERIDAPKGSFAGEFKRDLANPDPVLDTGDTPSDLVRRLFEAMAAKAKSELARLTPGRSNTLGRTVLTVPASYRDPVSYGPPWTLRGLMVAKAQEAGLGPIELMPEPVAAAWGLRSQLGRDGRRYVLVYDFGGGTFDTALIQMGPGEEWRVLGADSESVGGMDIDLAVAELLKNKSADWVRATIGQGSEQEVRQRRYRVDIAARAEAENQKIQLAMTNQPQTWAQVLRDAPPVLLTADELNQLASEHISKTIYCYRRLLKRAGKQVNDLDAVLMVGGTTKLPLVKTLVEADLRAGLPRGTGPKIGSFGLDVDRAVALGAAQWACEPDNEIAMLPPLPPRPGGSVLRWSLNDPARPGSGEPRLMRWHQRPTQPYQAGSPLARVRYADGTLWDLAASEAGELQQLLTDPEEAGEAPDTGVPITSRQWLATVERTTSRGTGSRGTNRRA
jgi:molecular chaperone DnaK (HSP70)